MAGVAGKSGRHKRADDRASENLEGLFLRLRSEILTKVWSCKGKIEDREGVSLSKAEAVERILEAGCEALERTREGRAAPATISKISEISGDDVSVPGYGFPEDEEEIAEPLPTAQPAPASHTNGKVAPASSVPQAAEMFTAASEPIVEQPPNSKTPARHGLPRETLQAIADERTLCEGLSLREFAQRLHAKGIHSSTARDGSKGPVNQGTLAKWLKQAQDEGLL